VYIFNTVSIKKCVSFLGERFEAGWVVEQYIVAIEHAMKDAFNKKRKIRTVACNFGISKTTLSRHLVKFQVQKNTC
jgi:predicted transcriptional regulator YheO